MITREHLEDDDLNDLMAVGEVCGNQLIKVVAEAVTGRPSISCATMAADTAVLTPCAKRALVDCQPLAPPSKLRHSPGRASVELVAIRAGVTRSSMTSSSSVRSSKTGRRTSRQLPDLLRAFSFLIARSSRSQRCNVLT